MTTCTCSLSQAEPAFWARLQHLGETAHGTQVAASSTQEDACSQYAVFTFMGTHSGERIDWSQLGEDCAVIARIYDGPSMPALNTKGYSSTDLAMGFANVRAGTQKRRAVFGYPPEH